MGRQYNVGDRVALSAVVKFANPRRELVVLQFPDGSETQPMKFEMVEALETDARSMIYTPNATPQVDSKPQGD